jgi:hypothetical protein
MEKHKCNKCNKEATVVEHGKYFCSPFSLQYVFSNGYKTTNRRVNNGEKYFKRIK